MAVNELRAFLAQTRVQLQKYINFDGSLKQELPGPRRSEAGALIEPDYAHFFNYDESMTQASLEMELFDVATLIDTTLFRAYMLVSPSLAGSLFRLDNFCEAEVVEDKLYESGRFNELIDFLWGKKLHTEALELLEKLGKDTSQADTLKEFRGPSRTVRYLQQLPFEQIDLILKHATWPLREYPQEGIQIFIADTENAETLPRDKVIQFLETFDPSIVLRYLEHIVQELDDKTAAFHDRLVRLYLAAVKGEAQFGDQGDVLHWQQKLESFLSLSKNFDKNGILKELPTDGEADHFSETALADVKFRPSLLRVPRNSAR